MCAQKGETNFVRHCNSGEEAITVRKPRSTDSGDARIPIAAAVFGEVQKAPTYGDARQKS